MSNRGNALYDDLFPSLISDIKSYNGTDPILPWLRGIRKMKETLPPQLLKEKLPRFFQKCAETFLTDRRYRNDLRYLNIWLQLMDFVDDPKAVLRKMEANKIGMKKSLFYQAYALYYEKMKKFDAAEKIYHMGVQNLAEPVDELQKSYEQFLHRLERHKNKRVQLQARMLNKRAFQPGDSHRHEQPSQIQNKADPSRGTQNEIPVKEAKPHHIGVPNDRFTTNVEGKLEEKWRHCSDDTVVVKFVDTAIVGKANAEDSRHHGLVEPTINTREAMNAINSMFQWPLESSIAGRANQRQSKTGNNPKNGFEVFSDENLSYQTSSKNPSNTTFERSVANQPIDEPFEIYVDSEEINDVKEKSNKQGTQSQKSENVNTSNGHALVFAKPNDLPSECSKATNTRRAHQAGLREDTVVYRFVGSTISDEPKVENVWHHGLVEPTVNLKEAMDDINSMFGKPIEYVRKSRTRKHDKAPEVKNNCEGFLILPDDEPETYKRDDQIGWKSQRPQNFATKHSQKHQVKGADAVDNHSGFMILPDYELDNQQEKSLPSSSTRNDNDLFEQTVCTKEAMAEISKLFAMPMDF